MVSYCVPLMVTGILQLLYKAADMIVLGQFSSDAAVGAVGACDSLITLLTNLFMSLSIGVSVSVSQYVGAKRDKDISEVVHTAFSISLIMGVFVGIMGFIMSEPALRAMGTMESTLIEGVPYMKAYMIGVPGIIVYNYCAAALRAKGDTVRPLIFLGVSGLANVGLNMWMVIGLGLGAVGVGIATAVSQYIAAILVVGYMAIVPKDSFRLTFRRFILKKDKLWLIFKIGLPAGLQGTMFSLSNVIIQSSVNSFGEQFIVDGNAAAANLEGFIYTSLNSVYHGALVFVAQHVGAKKYKRINRVVFTAMGYVTVLGLSLAVLMLIFGKNLLSFYISSQDAIAFGEYRMLFIVPLYFLCGLMEVGCGFLRGVGKNLTPMIVSLAGICGFRIIWAFTIFQLIHTPACLFISYPISWLTTGAIQIILGFIAKKKLEISDASVADTSVIENA